MTGISGTAVLALVAVLASSAPPIPAETPLRGPLWSLVVPTLLFALTFSSTYLLFRHFAGDRRSKRK